MSKPRILVIEDEEDIQMLISFNLNKEGYEILIESSGEKGLETARRKNPDLILLDLMLPGMSGFDVCSTLKEEEATDGIPIVMITAKSEEEDIVKGLELGADDYITKPFSVKVLCARVKTVLRRKKKHGPDGDQPLVIDEMTIHPGKHIVTVQGNEVSLTYSEFSILYFLASRPGWVYTRYQIVDAVRGEDHNVTDRSVDVHIVGLRRKLGYYGKYIETIRGIGYKFREQ